MYIIYVYMYIRIFVLIKCRKTSINGDGFEEFLDGEIIANHLLLWPRSDAFNKWEAKENPCSGLCAMLIFQKIHRMTKFFRKKFDNKQSSKVQPHRPFLNLFNVIGMCSKE